MLPLSAWCQFSGNLSYVEGGGQRAGEKRNPACAFDELATHARGAQLSAHLLPSSTRNEVLRSGIQGRPTEDLALPSLANPNPSTRQWPQQEKYPQCVTLQQARQADDRQTRRTSVAGNVLVWMALFRQCLAPARRVGQRPGAHSISSRRLQQGASGTRRRQQLSRMTPKARRFQEYDTF